MLKHGSRLSLLNKVKQESLDLRQEVDRLVGELILRENELREHLEFGSPFSPPAESINRQIQRVEASATELANLARNFIYWKDAVPPKVSWRRGEGGVNYRRIET